MLDFYYTCVKFKCNMSKKHYNIIALFILIIILTILFIVPQFYKDSKKGVAAMNDIRNLQAVIEQYKINYGQYPMSTPDNSSKVLIVAFQGDPNTNPSKPQFYDFPQKRVVNGEFISPFGHPYYYRENASKKVKTPDMHNPDSFDIWTQDAEGRPDGINNWQFER